MGTGGGDGGGLRWSCRAVRCGVACYVCDAECAIYRDLSRGVRACCVVSMLLVGAIGGTWPIM